MELPSPFSYFSFEPEMNAYLAQPQHRAHVVVVLLDLLPEPHGLVVLRRVYVLRPTALHVIHALAQELGPLRVHLKISNCNVCKCLLHM